MYGQGELAELVDAFLTVDLDLDEACKFLKIALLCTQDMPKLRPAMSSVVEMLTGESDWDENKVITKPGLFNEFMDNDDGKDKAGVKDSISGDSTKTSSSDTNVVSVATMTFTSINDRSK